MNETPVSLSLSYLINELEFIKNTRWDMGENPDDKKKSIVGKSEVKEKRLKRNCCFVGVLFRWWVCFELKNAMVHLVYSMKSSLYIRWGRDIETIRSLFSLLSLDTKMFSCFLCWILPDGTRVY